MVPAAVEQPIPSEPRSVRARAKAEAAGRLEEALAAYQEAALLAPQDTAIVEHAAALRSKLVRVHTEAAERDAPGGPHGSGYRGVSRRPAYRSGRYHRAERLAQMKTMADEPPAKPRRKSPGLPKLHALPEKHNLDLRGDTKTSTNRQPPRSASRPFSIRT